MKLLTFIGFLLLFCSLQSFAQVESEEAARYKREKAYEAIREMKDSGVLIVRLHTKDQKINAYQSALNSSTIKPGKRKRYQAILDATIDKRNQINQAMAESFIDSFAFCPTYIVFDSSTNTLKKGVKSGIFYNREVVADPEISLPDDRPYLFVIYYHEKGGEKPYDGLMLRRISGKIEDPFPNFIAIRSSFIDDINTPRIRRAVPSLDNYLHKFYEKATR